MKGILLKNDVKKCLNVGKDFNGEEPIHLRFIKSIKLCRESKVEHGTTAENKHGNDIDSDNWT